MNWKPIETAPKDRRIMLYYPQQIFNGVNIIFGKWDKDKYHKNPKPYFTHDFERIYGVGKTRFNQPTHWNEIPDAPIN